MKRQLTFVRVLVSLALLFPASTASGTESPPADIAATRTTWKNISFKIQSELDRRDLTGAIAAAERALAFADGELGPKSGAAFLSVVKLAFLYDHVGRYSDAEPLHLRAVAMREETLGPDALETLTAVNELAVWRYARAQYDEGARLFLRALEGRRRRLGPDHPETLATAGNLAALHERQGRFAEAETLLLEVVQRSEAKLGGDHPDTLLALSNLAVLYNSQGRHAAAEPLLVRVARTREQRLGADHADTILAESNLAAVHEALGRYVAAERLHRDALARRERILGRDHPDTAVSLTNLALVYRRQGRLPEAETLLVRALAVRDKALGKTHPLTFAAMNNLAAVLNLRGRHEAAEALLEEALTGLRATLGPQHPDVAEVATNLALLRLVHLRDARKATEAAREAVSSLRARRDVGLGDLRADAQRDREERSRSERFVLLADAAWAHPDRRSAALVSEAFLALQEASNDVTTRAVARTASRRLAEKAVSGLGARIREREAMEARWRWNAQRFSEALGEAGADAAALRVALEAERVAIEGRMDALDAAFRREFPRYAEFAQPEALDLGAVQRLLGPDEAALLLVPTAFGTHAIAVSRDGAQWFRSDWTRGRVDEAVRRLRASLATEETAFDRRTAFALHQQLVGPVAGQLRDKAHVFVAAAGSLSTLPLGVLVSEEPTGSDSDAAALRNARWFADDHALVQIPSIQSLAMLRRSGASSRHGPTGRARFLGFGDPALGPRSAERRGWRAPSERGASVASPMGRVADVRRINQLTRLPGTAAELRSLKAAFDADRATVFLGRDATEARLKSLDVSDVDVLALATHGLLAGELDAGLEPGLVFTPPTTGDQLDDGLLTASEVAALTLNADWVIMSACNTAAGDGSAEAPGLSGLARAFFYAGARTLLVSHWPVRDDVAAVLTVSTLQLLRESPGLSRAQALQRAMRQVRNESAFDGGGDTWAHPGAWAPFSLVGDSGTIGNAEATQ